MPSACDCDLLLLVSASTTRVSCWTGGTSRVRLQQAPDNCTPKIDSLQCARTQIHTDHRLTCRRQQDSFCAYNTACMSGVHGTGAWNGFTGPQNRTQEVHLGGWGGWLTNEPKKKISLEMQNIAQPSYTGISQPHYLSTDGQSCLAEAHKRTATHILPRYTGLPPTLTEEARQLGITPVGGEVGDWRSLLGCSETPVACPSHCASRAATGTEGWAGTGIC